MNRPIQVKPADSESRGGKRRLSSDTSDTETSVQPGTFVSLSDGDFGPAKIKPCDLHEAAAARAAMMQLSYYYSTHLPLLPAPCLNPAHV